MTLSRSHINKLTEGLVLNHKTKSVSRVSWLFYFYDSDNLNGSGLDLVPFSLMVNLSLYCKKLPCRKTTMEEFTIFRFESLELEQVSFRSLLLIQRIFNKVAFFHTRVQ